MEELVGFCRGCLVKCDDLNDLILYSEKNRRQFVYCTGLQGDCHLTPVPPWRTPVQNDEIPIPQEIGRVPDDVFLHRKHVKRNDLFAFQLCKECYLHMTTSCKFKKQCRTSEKYFKNYLALKEAGDVADFCTFVKNIENNAAQRFPFMSSYGYSAAERKVGEDDNVSTSTSIRNFMSDLMKGEEIPDTEETIIKEVLEEEKDLMDDTLDSQWLQDDASVDTDFNIDFSSFSTPRPEYNDWSYTPNKTYSVSTPQVSENILKVKSQSTEAVIPDTIDRNLERALQKGNKLEYRLDDLLQSSNEQSHVTTPVTDEQPRDEDDSDSEVEEIIIDESDGECDVFTKMDLLDQQAESKTEEEPPRKALNFYVDLEESDFEVNVDEINVIDDAQPENCPDQVVAQTEPNTSKPTKKEIENKYCNKCEKKLYSLSELLKHFREGHPKYLICDICQKNFTSKSNIIRHFAQHDRESTFTCKVCKEKVLVLDRYKHKRIHVPRVNVFTCDTCGYSTQNQSNFNTHVRRHRKEYVYSCQHCGKGFYTKYAHCYHVRRHSSEPAVKPCKCNFCGKSFKRSDYLLNHIRCLHNKETKQFQCDYCSKTFKLKKYLLHHMGNKKCLRFTKKMESENEAEPTLNITYANVKTEDLAVTNPDKLTIRKEQQNKEE